MKSKGVWKMTLSLGLFLLMGFVTAGFGRGNDQIIQYGELADDYLNKCENTVRSSEAKLKECLEKARKLRDQLGPFLKNAEAIVYQLKSARVWNRELDEKFSGSAKEQGLDAAVINEIVQGGGLRAYYQKAFPQLEQSKTQFDAEIKRLESELKKSSSDRDVSFQTASYSSENELKRIGLKTVLKAAYIIAKTIIWACDVTGACK